MALDSLNERIAQTALRLRNRPFLLLDIVLLSLIPLLALALRTDDTLSASYVPSLVVYTVVSLPLWVGVFL